MYWNISVSLLIPVVLWYIVKIISSHNNGPLHFVRDDNTLENLASNGNIGGEWAFFINVSRFNGFLRCSNTKSDIFIETNTGTGLLG